MSNCQDQRLSDKYFRQMMQDWIVITWLGFRRNSQGKERVVCATHF